MGRIIHCLYRKHLFPFFFIALAVGFAFFVLLIPSEYIAARHKFESVLAALGLAGGFVYFLYNQHLEETRLLKELFTEFNARYNKLNEGMNEICSKIEIGEKCKEEYELSPKDKECLNDYFNLCAEQFYFQKLGYIPLDVWTSWKTGMNFFFNKPQIKRLWDDEIKNHLEESYYGFNPFVWDTRNYCLSTMPCNKCGVTRTKNGTRSAVSIPRQP